MGELGEKKNQQHNRKATPTPSPQEKVNRYERIDQQADCKRADAVSKWPTANGPRARRDRSYCQDQHQQRTRSSVWRLL
jgi:hypothetical protein